MLKKWMDANKLTTNPQKSQIMIVNPKTRKQNKNFMLFYDNVEIKAVRTTKYLSMHLHDNINFETQLLYLEKRISQNVGVLTKLKHCLCNSTSNNFIMLLFILISSMA